MTEGRACSLASCSTWCRKGPVVSSADSRQHSCRERRTGLWPQGGGSERQ